MYDEKGRLTRAGAEQVIKGGGSVSIGNSVISSIDKLPSEADFAKGDDKAEREARERLQKTIADAQSQLAQIESSGGESKSPEPIETATAKTTATHKSHKA